MTNYVQVVNFGPKDSLPSGNPSKLIKGVEVDAELALIATAIASKLDTSSASSLGANPTGTIGLVAVNGVASTLIRSDGAPALSQAIVPTWSGIHTFAAAPVITSDHFSVQNTDNYFESRETDQGADGKVWWWRFSGGNATLQTRTDAGGAGTDGIVLTRTGVNISALIFGNATSNPTTSFLGTGVISAGGVFRGPAGAQGAPTYSFSGETTLGWYRPGAGEMRAVISSNTIFGVQSAATGGAYVADYGGTAQIVGFRNVPQNAQTTNYTLVLADSGKHIHHASGAGAGDTYTIPANASVAYDIGTVLTFTNLDSNALSIAITSDTMRLAGSGATGTRTLAQYGIATALKIASTEWLISGTNLT